MRKKYLLPAFIALFILLTSFVIFLMMPVDEILAEEVMEDVPVIETIPEKRDFGLVLDSFIVIENKVKPAEFLANILLAYNVPYPTIHLLEKRADTVFDVRKIAAGRKYYILCPKADSSHAKYFIYQPNEIDYVVCDLYDSVSVRRGQKEVETSVNSMAGVIESSLYEALTDNGGSPMLAMKMADIFAWSIDFYRIQKGDWFKVIYEEKKVDGVPIGLGEILAIDFNHEGRDFYGFYFTQDGHPDYFDDEANSLRKAFLKSPLKFSRLTSGYTQRRFHPVQKRWKAHLGTDYAAPKGTPILATGDGKVIEARYKAFNGNYVKIKHNGTYQTQYLHMSSIKPGISPGVYVKQGEVIGYVGSTGLATGPHVCYRFWKNDQQVNHLQEEFPPSEPVKEENIQAFTQEKEKFKQRLNEISLDGEMTPSLTQVGSVSPHFLQ